MEACGLIAPSAPNPRPQVAPPSEPELHIIKPETEQERQINAHTRQQQHDREQGDVTEEQWLVNNPMDHKEANGKPHSVENVIPLQGELVTGLSSEKSAAGVAPHLSTAGDPVAGTIPYYSPDGATESGDRTKRDVGLIYLPQYVLQEIISTNKDKFNNNQVTINQH
jgi:hypothetical protein